MADSGRLRGWKYDHANSILEAWNNGVKVAEYTTVASGVNFIQTTAAVACASPEIIGAGSDTNVGITFDTKAAGEYIFQSGGVDMLNMHDAAGVSFVAATDVAGHPLFLQTEDGGVASAGTAGAGGLYNIQSGDGGAGVAACNRAGGSGGAISFVGGAGGAIVACDSGAAGTGGAFNVTGGAGGSIPAGASGAPGLGGAINLTGGVGSSTAIACGDVAGVGGGLTFAAGAGGVDTGACGGTAAVGGAVSVSAGVGGASTAGVGGAGGALELFGGQGGVGTGGSCGGAAGDVIIHTGSAVEGGAVGGLLLRNNTTGIGIVTATECSNVVTMPAGVGRVGYITTWQTDWTTASGTGVMLIKIT